MQIIPSIVPENLMDIESKLKRLEATGLVEWAHIDIVDGRFASPATWPYTEDDIDGEIKDFGDIKTALKLGLHMMCRYPGDQLDEWIDTPLERISIHDELIRGADSLLALLDMSKCESCVVLKLDTDISELADLVDEIDAIGRTRGGGFGGGV